MPRYEYRCEANGRTIEVPHAMSETVSSWGQLCERAGIETGDTPPKSPVEKLISMPIAHTSGQGTGSAKGHTPPAGGCGHGCGCVGH